MLEAMQIEMTRGDSDDAAQLLAVIADPVRWRLVAELDSLAVDAGDRLAEALPARSGEPLVIDDKRMLSGRVPHTAEVRELSTATQH